MSDDANRFDTNAFLAGLDAIFERHAAAKEAEPYLQQAMADAENAGDDAGLLTVLNETMGFYRSQGRHESNQWIVQRTIELALRMGLEGSEAWATTLINCATAMRAAGRYDQSEELYRQALACALTTFDANDRRIAALHNNLSMLYSETDRLEEAAHELREALRCIEAANVNPDAEIDAASSHKNLALVLLAEHRLDEADRHASRALQIYANGHLEHSAHYASALAGCAQVRFAQHRYAEAVEAYREALDVIEACYGKDTDYYRTTEANLREAKQAMGHSDSSGSPRNAARATPHTSHQTHADTVAVNGLALARAFWLQEGKPMLDKRYPQYAWRIAAGLVGHGSECYGFDDEYSQDHDFGPRFCLWLTDEDDATIGKRLQADYEALPRSFTLDAQGRPRFTHDADATPQSSPVTPRASGEMRRDGVFRIGGFFEQLTGYAQAPGAAHEWMMLDEATLAAATNGEVFADPLGMLSKTRQGFKDMPEDVRLALISRRLGMIAQSGQYNLPRCLKRGDAAAAWLSIREFVNACTSLVFLVNTPMVAGYMPYYKWQFAALRRLSGRVFARLGDVCDGLESVMRLSSAACYGGAGFGEGGQGSTGAAERIEATIEDIARHIVRELKREGLTRSEETFLEWQRPYVEEHIISNEACLHSL